VTEEDLEDYFKSCGEIKSVELLKNHDGSSKGCANVQFMSTASVQSALDLNASFLKNEKMRVNRSRESAEMKWTKKARPDNCDTLYVGNLPDVSERELEEFFTECGIVREIKFSYDLSGKPKNYCLIEFADLSSLDRAVRLNTQLYKTKPLRIEYAHTKKN